MRLNFNSAENLQFAINSNSKDKNLSHPVVRNIKKAIVLWIYTKFIPFEIILIN